MSDNSLLNADASSAGNVIAKDLVRGAFAADALCLGPHWIYDLGEIESLYPDGIPELDAPRSSYHGSKKAGDFTHHGDQSLALLESLANRGIADSEAWREDFAQYWASEPNCYLDGAARDTLKHFKEGLARPSGSDDLAGVSRIAPLLTLLADVSVEQQVAKARELVGTTHGDPIVSDAAEFFVRSLFELKSGRSYLDAFEQALATGRYGVRISEYVSAAKAKQGMSAQAAAQSLGQSCATDKAFPLTLWMALNFGENPVEMMKVNALAGGDNSARGMILGMLLAARGEFSKLPVSWSSRQNSAGRIEALLDRLGS